MAETYYRVCLGCRSAFETDQKYKTHCTKRCVRIAWQEKNPERMRLLRERERRKERDLRAPFSRVALNVCRYCDKEWFGRKGPYCSDGCRKQDASDKAHARSVGQHVPVQACCVQCGTAFKTQYGDKRKMFCSKECASYAGRRVAKAKRRAVERGLQADNINPYVVFSQAAWVCQLCGVDTPRIHRGTTYATAPELDHIIPLAMGGSHTWENVQLLCRSCNSEKADTVPQGVTFDYTHPCYSMFDETNNVSEDELRDARIRNARRLREARDSRTRVGIVKPPEQR